MVKAIGILLTFWLFISIPFSFVGSAVIFPVDVSVTAIQELFLTVAHSLIFFGPLALALLFLLWSRKTNRASVNLEEQC